MSGNNSPVSPEGADDDNQGVVIDTAGGSSTQVSFQQLQAVYNALTGKTEKITKQFDRPVRVEINDLIQLDARIAQTLEQYNVKARTCTVTVFHKEDVKEVYSSFERFKAYDSSRLCPVERIQVAYEFLILLPKVNKPQTYTLTIWLVSGVVVFKEMREKLPKELFAIFGTKSGYVEVEYVDYMVARNFVSIVDGWSKSLPVAPRQPVLEKIISKSHYFPVLFKYALLVACAYAITTKISPATLHGTNSFIDLSTVLIWSGVFLFILYRVGLRIGEAVESYIDAYQPLTYIHLNRGDKILIDETHKENGKTLTFAFLGFLGELAMLVAAHLIATWIANH